MRTTLFFLVFVFAYYVAESQSCSIPQPLTKEQKQMVNGTWQGYYELNNTKTTFTVSVNFDDEANLVECSNPPVEGTITHEEYRFCGAGAFHFKKFVHDNFFEFDGVPNEGSMKGTLVLSVGNVKKNGKFFLEKIGQSR